MKNAGRKILNNHPGEIYSTDDNGGKQKGQFALSGSGSLRRSMNATGHSYL
jgi:hypothetical protein